jgi:hypothetical protein
LQYSQSDKIKNIIHIYILVDRAYDTKPIQTCVNEEIGAFNQIPLKTRAKKKVTTDLKAKKSFD